MNRNREKVVKAKKTTVSVLQWNRVQDIAGSASRDVKAREKVSGTQWGGARSTLGSVRRGDGEPTAVDRASRVDSLRAERPKPALENSVKIPNVLLTLRNVADTISPSDVRYTNKGQR